MRANSTTSDFNALEESPNNFTGVSEPPCQSESEHGGDHSDIAGVGEGLQDEDATESINNAQVRVGEERRGKDNSKVVNYETFESSSEDEFSQGAFESANNSVLNKEKNPDQNQSEVVDNKRLERQRRKERKLGEKLKAKAEQDRQKRKNIRRNFRL